VNGRVVVAAALIVMVTGTMSPADVGSPGGALLRLDSLHSWALMVGAEKQERKIGYGEGRDWLLVSQTIYGGLTWDATDWLRVEGGAGGTSVKEGKEQGYGDVDAMWGGRMTLGLVEHMMKKPSTPEALLRLYGSFSHWDHEAVLFDEDVGWTEMRGELVLSAAFLAEDIGFNEPMCPSGVSFQLGAVYSGIRSKEGHTGESAWRESAGAENARFREGQEMGGLGGIDIYLAPNVSLAWEMRVFSEPTHAVTLTVGF